MKREIYDQDDGVVRLMTPAEIRQEITDRQAILNMREARARSEYHAALESIQREREMLAMEWRKTFENGDD